MAGSPSSTGSTATKGSRPSTTHSPTHAPPGGRRRPAFPTTARRPRPRGGGGGGGFRKAGGGAGGGRHPRQGRRRAGGRVPAGQGSGPDDRDPRRRAPDRLDRGQRRLVGVRHAGGEPARERAEGARGPRGGEEAAAARGVGMARALERLFTIEDW